MSPAHLTLKYYYCFRPFSTNILLTSNSSNVSTDMGSLLYTIDSHIELVSFGYIVVHKMLDYVAHAISKSRVLPYPSLITNLLESQRVVPQIDKNIVKTCRHLQNPSLYIMPNDFKSKIPVAGEALAKEICGMLIDYNSIIQQVIDSLMNVNRFVA